MSFKLPTTRTTRKTKAKPIVYTLKTPNYQRAFNKAMRKSGMTAARLTEYMVTTCLTDIGYVRNER